MIFRICRPQIGRADAHGEGRPAGDRDLLAIAPAEVGKPFVYYIGAGWERERRFSRRKIVD